MSNRVEELESRVAELQAAVDGLTEELVETRERLRALEDGAGADGGSRRAPLTPGDGDAEAGDGTASPADPDGSADAGADTDSDADAETGDGAEGPPESDSTAPSDSDSDDIIVA
ncbi:MAG: chromosome segregation protein SMC [Haloferacaceae archaeon]